MQRNHTQSLSTAFGTWCGNVQKIKMLAAKACRVATRVLNEMSSMCLEAWHQHTKREIQKQAITRRFLMRMVGNFLSGSLQQWADKVVVLQRERVLMKRVAMKMTGNFLAVCFNRWAHNAQELQRDNMEEARKQHLIKRMVSRILGQVVANRFEFWCHYSVEKKRMHAKALKVIGRLTKSELVRCLERWCVLLAQLKEETRHHFAMDKLVLRVTRASLLPALGGWRVHTKQKLTRAGYVCLHVCMYVQCMYVW